MFSAQSDGVNQISDPSYVTRTAVPLIRSTTCFSNHGPESRVHACIPQEDDMAKLHTRKGSGLGDCSSNQIRPCGACIWCKSSKFGDSQPAGLLLCVVLTPSIPLHPLFWYFLCMAYVSCPI